MAKAARSWKIPGNIGPCDWRPLSVPCCCGRLHIAFWLWVTRRLTRRAEL